MVQGRRTQRVHQGERVCPGYPPPDDNAHAPPGQREAAVDRDRALIGSECRVPCRATEVLLSLEEGLKGGQRGGPERSGLDRGYRTGATQLAEQCHGKGIGRSVHVCCEIADLELTDGAPGAHVEEGTGEPDRVSPR